VKMLEKAADDLLAPFSSLSTAMRAREVEAIEKVMAGSSNWEDEEVAAAAIGRPLGPLQVCSTFASCTAGNHQGSNLARVRLPALCWDVGVTYISKCCLACKPGS
jgi:hypothetical protein